MKIYDAEGQVLGRMASVIAKQLLNGENVVVINAEKIILIGNRKDKIKNYMEKIHRGDPIHGPFFPKTPDRIFRRVVRGMLPCNRTRGREAFKLLRVSVGIPDYLKGKEDKFEKIKAAESKSRARHIMLGEIAVLIGAKKRW